MRTTGVAALLRSAKSSKPNTARASQKRGYNGTANEIPSPARMARVSQTRLRGYNSDFRRQRRVPVHPAQRASLPCGGPSLTAGPLTAMRRSLLLLRTLAARLRLATCGATAGKFRLRLPKSLADNPGAACRRFPWMEAACG